MRCPSTQPKPAALRGVIAIWTAADVADIPRHSVPRHESPSAWNPIASPILAHQPCPLRAGEPIAVVFATDAYIAEDAADLVVADIEDAARLSSTPPQIRSNSCPA